MIFLINLPSDYPIILTKFFFINQDMYLCILVLFYLVDSIFYSFRCLTCLFFFFLINPKLQKFKQEQFINIRHKTLDTNNKVPEIFIFILKIIISLNYRVVNIIFFLITLLLYFHSLNQKNKCKYCKIYKSKCKSMKIKIFPC